MSSGFPWTAAVVALAVSSIASSVVPKASAQSVTALNGTYSGTFRCAQRVTNLTLTITATPVGELSARVTVYPSPGTSGQSYSYRLTGQYDARIAKFQLAPVAWETPHPDNVGMVGLNGTFDSNELTGTVIGTGCSSFEVERDRAGSTRTAAPQAGPPPATLPPAGPRQSPTTAAANRPTAAATGRTFCYSDLKQSVIYVSSVFLTQVAHDVLDLEPEDLLELGFVEIDFTEFLNGKYKYPFSEKVNEHGSDCVLGYRLSQSLVQQERIAWIAAQRKAGKRLVETGWTPAPTALLAPAEPPRGVAAQPATTTAGTRRSSPPAISGNGSSGRIVAGAVTLKWHPDTQQPQNVLKADPVFVNLNTEIVFMEAVCAPNGASVNFKVFDRDGKTGPQFDHHDDPSGASKTEIVDIDVSVDGRSHVAKGFLPIVDDKQAVNNVGVLFYEPGIAVKTRGERQFVGRLGASVDNIIGAAAAAEANAEIEEGLRTSAGPLSDLVKAKSIEMRVPILGARAKAAFELSPTTPLFQAFAERCYARFGGSPASQPAAPASEPSRSRPANPAGTRRVR